MNPGLMKTELQRHSPKMQSVIMVCLLLPTVPITYHISVHPLPAIILPLTCLLFRASSSSLPFSAPTANSSQPFHPKLRPSRTVALLFPGAALETSLTTSRRDSSRERREVQGQRTNSGAGASGRQSLICKARRILWRRRSSMRRSLAADY